MAIAIDESKITYSGDGEANLQNFDVYTKTEINSAVQGTSSLYDETATYTLGSYCIYNNTLYRSTTAITTPEPFTSGHWESVSLSGLKDEVNGNSKKIAGIVEPRWHVFSAQIQFTGVVDYYNAWITTNLPKGYFLLLIYTKNTSAEPSLILGQVDQMEGGVLLNSVNSMQTGNNGGGIISMAIINPNQNQNSIRVSCYNYGEDSSKQLFTIFAIQLGAWLAI